MLIYKAERKKKRKKKGKKDRKIKLEVKLLILINSETEEVSRRKCAENVLTHVERQYKERIIQTQWRDD